MSFDKGWRGAVALCTLSALAGCSTCGLPAGACEQTADCPHGFWCNPQQGLCVAQTDASAPDAARTDALPLDNQGRDAIGPDGATPDAGSADLRRDAGVGDLGRSDRAPIDAAATDHPAAPDARPDQGAADTIGRDSGPIDTRQRDAAAGRDRPGARDAGAGDSGCVLERRTTLQGPRRIVASGNDLFIAAGNLEWWRRSGPSIVSSASASATSGQPYVDVAVDDSAIYAADGSDLTVFTRGSSPALSSIATRAWRPSTLALSGTTLFFGGTTAGAGFSYSVLPGLSTPVPVGTDPAMYVNGLHVSGSRLHVVGSPYSATRVQYGLFSFAAGPIVNSCGSGIAFSGESACDRVVAAADRIYAACGTAGLVCNRYHDPPQLDGCGSWDTRAVHDVEMGAGVIYAADASGLMRLPVTESPTPRYYPIAGGVPHAIAISSDETLAFVGLYGPANDGAAAGEVVIVDLECAF